MATDVVDREIVSEQEGNSATMAFPVAHVLCDCVNLSQAHNILYSEDVASSSSSAFGS
jgi:hypothetical protein